MTDPIADMLTRIKNAQAVGKDTVFIPFSKLKHEITRVLKDEQLIAGFAKKGRGVNKRIEITLLYQNDAPRISDFRRISKPSQRQYSGHQKLFPVRSGFGISVLSTSKGIMSDKEARKNHLGGEVLFEAW